MSKNITVHFDVDVPEEDLIAFLWRRAMGQAPDLQAAMEEQDFDRGLLEPADHVRVEGEQSLAPPPSAHPPAASPSVAEEPAQDKRARARTARGNGKGKGDEPEAPPDERKPLAEPEMRELLTDVSNVHPQKVAAVVALLREHGGSARLLDCPPEKWLGIEDAARGVLAELQVARGP